MAENFMKMAGFNRMVRKSQRCNIPGSELFFPAFETHDEAMGFGLYIAAYFRRVVKDLRTHVTVRGGARGFVARCQVQYPGLRQEDGLIVCKGGDSLGVGGECEGILLSHDRHGYLLPLKQHLYTAVTESGSEYVAFADGTAFCHSTSGPQMLAVAMYFASSFTDGDHVQKHGGNLLVATSPATNLVPIYCFEKPTAGAPRGMVFKANSYRIGTRIKDIRPA